MSKGLKTVLLVLIIFLEGVFVFYYASNSSRSKSPPAALSPTSPSLTEEQKSLQAQKDTAIAELQVRMATNPKVTQAQRDKALQDLKKRMTK